MPNVKNYIIERGVTLQNHITVVPLCGPSRASMLTGRFPHNTGYLTNDDKHSISSFLKTQEDNVGRWLTEVGYYTSYLGKYVNNFDNLIPGGWRHWGGFTNVYVDGHKVGGAYRYWNASQWLLDYDVDGKEVPKAREDRWKIWEGTHQADFLGSQAVDEMQVAVAEERPFFIVVAPLMVHSGPCEGPFDDESLYKEGDPHWETKLVDLAGNVRNFEISPCPKQKYPSAVDWARANSAMRQPSYNVTAVGQGAGHKPLEDFDRERQVIGENKRAQSAVDLDGMVGVIMRGLRDAKLFENTYVIFTSDNGFHLGQHQQNYGKNNPWETDLRVPMYVRGPAVVSGVRRFHPTNQVDTALTILDLAGAGDHVSAELDGLSFAKVLTGKSPSIENWRTYSFAENFAGETTWHAVRHIDPSTGAADWSMHRWCNNRPSELYHMSHSDHYQMLNLLRAPEPPEETTENEELRALGVDDDGNLAFATSEEKAFSQNTLDRWWPRLVGYASCAGAAECNGDGDPKAAASAPSEAHTAELKCYTKVSQKGVPS